MQDSDQEELDVQAQRDAVDTAAITVAASITNTWYQLAEAKALVRIVREQIRTNEKVLKIVTVKWRNGAARAAERSIADLTLDEMEALWQEAKRQN